MGGRLKKRTFRKPRNTERVKCLRLGNLDNNLMMSHYITQLSTVNFSKVFSVTLPDIMFC